MPVNLKGRSFLTLKDFTPDEIRYMLNFYRGKGLAAPAFNGKRAAADFLPDSLVFCH